MSQDVLNLLERLQTNVNLDNLGEGRIDIEAELDRLSDVKGGELSDIWHEVVKSGADIPEGRLDVIDDIMAAQFGKEYKKYLRGEVVGESKDQKKGKGRKKEKKQEEEVPDTMKPTEKPEIDPEDYSMEDSEKKPDKKKQDTMFEPTKKELEQLIDKNKNKAVESVSNMFIEDQIDVMQIKMDHLKQQAKHLEKEQRGTRKATRGYDLQKYYTKIDSYEKKIAQLKKQMDENRNKATKPWFERKQLCICNECNRTFRSNANECIHCKSTNVEKIKVQEQEEKEEGSFKIVANGISDRDVADRLASEKNGTVIQDKDNEKFTVVVKETKLEEDIRSTVIGAFQPEGYFLSSEREDKDTGIRILTLTKGDEDIEVKIKTPGEKEEE